MEWYFDTNWEETKEWVLSALREVWGLTRHGWVANNSSAVYVIVYIIGEAKVSFEIGSKLMSRGQYWSYSHLCWGRGIIHQCTLTRWGQMHHRLYTITSR